MSHVDPAAKVYVVWDGLVLLDAKALNQWAAREDLPRLQQATPLACTPAKAARIIARLEARSGRGREFRMEAQPCGA